MLKKKILHIIPSLIEGGAERLALDICIELGKRDDIEVMLVLLQDKNDYPELSSVANYKVIEARYIPSLTGKPIIEINQLMQFIHEYKPHVIHSHLFEAELVSRLRVVKNIKYFTHCHDNMRQLKKFSLETVKNKTNLTEYYERLLLLSAYKKNNNAFIAISEHTRQYFLQNLPGACRKNIHLLHNAIDYKRFHRAVKHRTGMPLRLINVGSFVTKKNQAFLVDVIDFLVKQNHDVHLTLLGEGELRQSVQNKVTQMGLDSHISLPGNIEDVPAMLKNANLYVHAATYEPFGLALLEAMAAGLPVVTLDGGGNRDIIKQHQNGVMVFEQDSGKFAEAILRIARDENQYQSISKEAIACAATYDIKGYVDRLLKLYQA